MVEFSHPDNLDTVSRELMRNLNTRAITTVLFNQGETSRAELARKTGLTQATVSNITSKLLETDLIEEVGVGKSTGGRKPTLIDINNDFGYVVGVKIEKTHVLTSLFDLRVNLIEKTETSFGNVPTQAEIIDLISGEVTKYDSDVNVIGAGIGVSGLISDSGEIIYSPILDWENCRLREKLENELSLPVLVDNDVNAFTLAEGWFGAGRGFKNFLVVTVGEGIGAGIVIDGTLYRGAVGGAGEIGHTTLNPNGPRCRCGERGCLEAVASDYFLVNEMKKNGFDRADIDVLTTKADNGDRTSLEIFSRMGHNLGLGIKNLVNTLNPEAVLLGGERLQAANFFLPAVKEEILNHSFPQEARQLEIVTAELGKKAWLLGAAILPVRNFFSLPLHRKVGKKAGNGVTQNELR